MIPEKANAITGKQEQDAVKKLSEFLSKLKVAVLDASNGNAYHNEEHTTKALKELESITDILEKLNILFSPKKILLMKCALWGHDAAHPGGGLPDEKNIRIAQDVVKKVARECQLARKLVHEIQKLVLATIFPGNEHEITSELELVVEMSDLAAGGLFQPIEEFMNNAEKICDE